MQRDTPARRRSFKPYSVATFAVLAIVGAAVVFASVAPASAATLTHHVPVGLFAFMVPLVVLLFAILIEVARLAVRNEVPGEASAPVRSLAWSKRQQPR